MVCPCCRKSFYKESITKTSNLLSFLLVRHTPALDRLRDEIHSVLGEEPELTRTHVQKMSYLKCVLNESAYDHTHPH